jgi:hypothetical protein
MRPLLAIAVCLLIALQSVVAMARPVNLCCDEPCGDQAMCVIHACQGCAVQAVLPDMPRVAAIRAPHRLPDAPKQAEPVARVVDIWRPPQLMQVHLI